ncbi:MAG: hypothetical protein HY294_01620 [Candidatus Rokubacteria bacterium]|nr:hypothetical protein [Candidatus Rokubacteria bacterium]
MAVVMLVAAAAMLAWPVSAQAQSAQAIFQTLLGFSLIDTLGAGPFGPLTGANGATLRGTISFAANGDRICVCTLSGRGGTATDTVDIDGDLQAYVNANFALLQSILFPGGDVSASKQSLGGAQTKSFDVVNTIIAPPLSPKQLAALRQGLVGSEAPKFREAGSAIEYENFSLDGVGGQTFRLIPGLDFTLGALEVGARLPFRYTWNDDTDSTKLYIVGPDLYARYNFGITPQWTVGPIVGAFANLTLIDTNFDDKNSGFIRWGGFAGVTTRALIGPVFLTGGVIFTQATVSSPGSLQNGLLGPFVAAMPDLPDDKLVTVGANLGIPFLANFVANLRVSHSESVGSTSIPSGRKSPTEVGTSLTYFIATDLGIDAGWRTTLGVTGLTANTGAVTILYNF